MNSLQSKRALITGAAGGIGREIALRLAAEGTSLYLLDINPAGLAEVVGRAQQFGVEAMGRLCDVSQLQQIETSVAEGLNRWEGFDLLVNNAGVTYYGDTSQMRAGDCERLLAINLHAPLHFTRLLLPSLLSRPEAHVLNVASFLGLVGGRKMSIYSATKFGLVGFSESLRAEYARTNLGVTALCPGFVDTNLFASAQHGEDRQSAKRPPAWMLTTPEAVADRAIRAIRRNEALVVVQPYAKLAYYTKRFFPGLLDFANHLSRKRLGNRTSVTAPRAEERRAA